MIRIALAIIALVASASAAATGQRLCPELNGKFAVPGQCDAYIECVDGAPEKKLCNDGLVFNDKSGSEGCQFPQGVSCVNRTKLQPPKPTEDCPRQFGFFRIGDDAHCGQYMNCANGYGTLTDCPEGLAYNSEKWRCDYPEEVADCNPEAYVGFTCPPNAHTHVQHFASEEDDRHYFLCVNGRPRLHDCGENLVFNISTISCNLLDDIDIEETDVIEPDHITKYGKFAVPGQCDAYMEYVNGVPEEKLCFDGLVFNDKLGSEGCQLPQGVSCVNRTKLQPPKPTKDCPHQFGIFAVPGQCDAYKECVDGIGEEKLCNDGLVFNDKSGSEGCQFPQGVSCVNRAKLQPAKPTKNCPRQYGFFRIGDEVHCGQYMNCVSGYGILTDCPLGLAYNSKKWRCDWPEEVEDCNPEAYLRFTCPRSTRRRPFKTEHFASEEDSRQYFVCVNGKPRLHDCGEDMFFNANTISCELLEDIGSGATDIIKPGHTTSDKEIPLKVQKSVKA